MLRFVSMVAFAVPALISCHAVAQSTQGAPPPRYFVPVVLEPTPRVTSLELRRMQDDIVIAECGGRCWTWAETGPYMVRVTDRQNKASTEVVVVEGPRRLMLEPPDRTLRSLGLALGITGTVIGSLGALGTALYCRDCGDDSDRDRWFLPTVATMFVTGVAMGTIGWVIFGKNRKLQVTPLPLEAPRAPESASSSWGVRVVPVAGGAMGAGAFAF